MRRKDKVWICPVGGSKEDSIAVTGLSKFKLREFAYDLDKSYKARFYFQEFIEELERETHTVIKEIRISRDIKIIGVEK